MANTIKKILREAILLKIAEYGNNISYFDNVICAPIWADDKSGNKFYLFVGFNNIDNIKEFSYSFILLDKENKPLTNYLTKRDDVNKYLPDDIKNKRLIFPIIEDMTRKLLNKSLPDEIIRRTVEPLEGGSLKRYEIITNILVNEYDYEVTDTYKDESNCTVWLLSKKSKTDKNNNMSESYTIGGLPPLEQSLKDTFDWVLPLLS